MRKFKKHGFTFAECATHVTLPPTKAKGFTLAETLITLGIIGVVAAITVPNLITNYQHKAWTAQLQKSYGVLNQGFRRMLAEENASLLSQTETFQSIGGTERNDGYGVKYKICGFDGVRNAGCNEGFLTNLRKYFKIANIGYQSFKTYYLNGSHEETYADTTITLMDGTIIFDAYFYSQDPENRTNNQMKGMVGRLYLDVNGLKRPNKYGRDIFLFYLGDNGIVYPYGSQTVSEYDSNGNKTLRHWKTTASAWYSCKNGGESYGAGCAARVLEEGKMNY